VLRRVPGDVVHRAIEGLFRPYLESAGEGERIQQFFARHGEEDLARMAGLAELAAQAGPAVEAESAAS